MLQNLKITWHYQTHLLFQDFQAILEIVLFLKINTFRYYFKSNMKFLIIYLARIFDLFFIKKNNFHILSIRKKTREMFMPVHKVGTSLTVS